GQDETTVAGLVALMSDRRRAVNQIRADAPFAPQPQWEQNARAAVEAAGVVFVAGDAERGALAGLNLGGDTVPMAFPVAPSPAQMAPIGSLVGGEGYVLMHAPLEPSQNQLQAARAAERADLPLVIAGPVVDAGYAALVRAFAGPRVVVLGEPDPATAESLYRSAEVFLDASWVGRGLVRAVRALSRGASLAISARLPAADLGIGDFARPVDPADVDGIARGLADAWYLRREEAVRFTEARIAAVARCALQRTVRDLLGGYARALRSRGARSAR
ncbi:MAG: hypothetical protein JOY59_12930, partial [Candidatus Eremiobacteraeota bacterium]|nr:hypothetical protein [Candidatus Eremiobacteraeota bacterium]